jgi:hypothetical protein
VGAAKAEAKLAECIIKCHMHRVTGKLADETAEDACETGLSDNSCTAKFAAAITKLKGCPPCINGTTMSSLAGLTESLIDGNNSTVYCDTSSGPPFGGDDPGDVPTAKSASAKCEAGAAKAEGKLIACIVKCHASRESGKLTDDTAEDWCEMSLTGKSCFASFTLAISKLKGCPPCINGTSMANLAVLTEEFIDTNNSAVYCSCGAGETLCGASCTNTQTDAANCGACGTKCPSGTSAAPGNASVRSPTPSAAGSASIRIPTPRTAGSAGRNVPSGRRASTAAARARRTSRRCATGAASISRPTRTTVAGAALRTRA